jgi:hypothetical protein
VQSWKSSRSIGFRCTGMPVQGLAWSVHWSHGQHSRGRSARLKVDRSLTPTHSVLIDEAVSWSSLSISPLVKRIPADMISTLDSPFGQGEGKSCVVDWNQDSRQYRADQSEGVQHAPIVYPSIPVVDWNQDSRQYRALIFSKPTGIYLKPTSNWSHVPISEC